MLRRVFPSAKALITTTSTGPRECDVDRRTIIDVKTGKILDQCRPDDTADEVLNRKLPVQRDIMVELVVKSAREEFNKMRPDVAEMFSPPRIVQ